MKSSVIKLASLYAEHRDNPEEAEKYELGLNALSCALEIVDKNSNILFLNERMRQIHGVGENEWTGKHCSITCSTLCGTENCSRKQLAKGIHKVAYTWEGIRYTADSDYLYDSEHQMIGWVEIFEKLGDEYDQLTGICNRRGFIRRTKKLLKENPEEAYILAVVNVQKFKLINELLGRDTGDECLRVIAGELEGQVGERGAYGRLESDRFVLCIPERSETMQRLQRCENREFVYRGSRVAFKNRIGIYRICKCSHSVEDMMDRANMALHSIKEGTGQRSAIYDEEMKRRFLEEEEYITRFERALENKEFVIYYQPVYNDENDHILSAEALVRWNHPGRGLIAPGAFIPVLEKNGLIRQLDLYVWEETCRYIDWRRTNGKELVPVSVNFSRVDFYDSDLSEAVIQIAERYRIDPELLRIEITETAYADDSQQLLRAVGDFKKAGYKILMDDFGSGYSSFNSLKDIPVDILKIDLKFLENFENSGKSSSIVSSIVRMAKWLGLSVIAEGAETKAQVDFLRSIGCTRIQGYYYSRPVPQDVFDEMLDHRKEVGDADYLRRMDDIDFNSIWDSSPTIQLLFQGIIGGMGLYELIDDQLEIVRVNDGYFEIMGGTALELFSNPKDSFERVCRPEDKKRLLEECRRAERTKQITKIQLQRKRFDGVLIWVEIKIRYLGTAGVRTAFYFAINDITKERMLEEGQAGTMNRLGTNGKYDSTSLSLNSETNKSAGADWKRHGTHSINEERFLTALSMVKQDVFEYDVRTNIIVQTQKNNEEKKWTYEQFVRPEQLVERGIVYRDDIETFLDMYRKIRKGEPEVEWTGRNHDIQGDIVWLHIHYKTIFDEVGRPITAIGVFENITEQVEAQHRVEEFDKQKKILAMDVVASATVNVTKYKMKHVECFRPKIMEKIHTEDCGIIINHLISHGADKKSKDKLSGYLNRDFILNSYVQGKRQIVFEYCMKSDSEKSEIWVAMVLLLERDKETHDVMLYGFIKDIQDQKSREISLESQAKMDKLTGILNRASFEKKVDDWIQAPENQRQYGAFLILDLDNFKRANDTYGHVYGDRLLVNTAKILKRLFRTHDYIGRLGGDEFVIFMTDVPGEDLVKEKADRVCETIYHNVTGGEHQKVSCSIGAAMTSVRDNSFEKLYIKADRALYRSKQLGKNQSHVSLIE
ncbi:MAG: EAL domain-containing protein [Hespellia sp.]|nr:EAL domain-containing protein [Hespellia sp.]